MSLEEKLISLVRENNVLYDKRSGGYKNVDKKREIWRKIGEELGESDNFVTTRWRSLRDKFVRELKAEKKPSGSHINLRGTWEFRDQMSFLIDHLQPRRTQGNYHDLLDESSVDGDLIEIDDGLDFATENYSSQYKDDATSNSFRTDASSSSSSTTFSSLKRRTSSVSDDKSTSSKKTKINNDSEVANAIIFTMESIQKYINDERPASSNQSGIRKIGNHLDNLNTHRRKVAENKIINYLIQCEMDELEDNSIEYLDI